MAGGEGSRLWPASRPEAPKPFLDLLGDKSLFQQTIERFAKGPEGLYAPPAVICVAPNLGLVRDQAAVPAVGLGTVVAEPLAAGTTICAAFGALLAADADPETLVLLAPSDHMISDSGAFHRAVEAAAETARAGKLVVLGVSPTSAATGCGYVRPGGPLAAGFTLAGFVEKPDAARAAELVAAGWLWNAGMFLGKAAALLAELDFHAPAHLAAARAALAAGARSKGLVVPEVRSLEGLEPAPFDRTVMEKTHVGAVVPLDCGWRDLGTWDAVWGEAAKDGDGNHLRGDVRLESSSGCLVSAEGLRVRVEGMSNVTVVATPAGVLVRPRG